MSKRCLCVPAVLVFLIFASPVSASLITFSELPPQPVNGLTFQGITFGFTVGGNPSTDATFGGSGPGTITFVQDPSLEGNSAGVLTIDFTGGPTSTLSFGVAVSTTDPLSPGFTVSLFDPTANLLGTFPVNTSPLVFFSEAEFSLSGPQIGRAVVTFSGSGPRFALDNITYESIPEPGTLGLMTLSALALGAVLWRRRS